MSTRHVLVAGATGLVGYAVAKHFAELPDWKVTAVSRRRPIGLDGVDVVSVDLSDALCANEMFSEMRDVTHVVFAAYSERPGSQGWRMSDQMEFNLTMLK